MEKRTSLNEYLSQPNDKLDEFVQLAPLEAALNDEDSEDAEEAVRAAAQEDLR